MKKGEDLFTGVILAGGKSSRLGMDKALIRIKGISLLERAINVLSPFCDEILLSSNNPHHAHASCRVIPDKNPGCGPMMGIYSSLLETSGRGILVLAVDNAGVERDFYSYLLLKLRDDHEVAVPFLEGRFHEPLTGFYSRSCLREMEKMMEAGNYRIPDLFDRVNVLRLKVEKDFPAYTPGYFRSLNEPEDLLQLSRE